MTVPRVYPSGRSIGAVCALALAVAAAPAQADWRITGHGFGHGAGLAQYGAMGYARETRHTHRWILRHYYPGTGRATRTGRVRVRLAQTVAARVTLASLARDGTGLRVAMHATAVYRFEPWSTDGLAMIDAATGRTRARLRSPVRITGSAPLRVPGPAENGVGGGRYRDAIVLRRAADQVLIINDIGLERYLYGVVPAEMPAGWPVEALRAQAVVARSYAVTSLRPAAPFDVYADTRSQVYRGVAGENARTTDAVRATRGVVVMFGSSVARTLFHSSSGGRTAPADEVFGGTPVAYMVSVEDPYDRLSPYHDWAVTLSDEEAARRLATVVPGDLVDIAVTQRTASGRAATVRVTGTLGVRDLPATSARSLLGLRSTWFTVARRPQ